MIAIHIHRARFQPATRYRIGGIEEAIWIRHPKRRTLRTVCCRTHRIAGNLRVQSHYDGDYFTCRPGAGCKAGNP